MGREAGPPDDQMLHDGQFFIGGHGADHAQHGVGRHVRIRVQHQEQFEPLGVVVQEVHHVASLEAGVLGAAAVADAPRIAVRSAERRHRLSLGCRPLGIARVERMNTAIRRRRRAGDASP